MSAAAMGWFGRWASGLSIVCATSACDEPRTAATPAGRSEALTGIVEGAIRPSVVAFLAASEALATAATEHMAAGGADGESLAQLRAAWQAAMDAWQVLEPMQVGPAAASLVDAKGEDLRDRIYSWPVTNACLIDQEIVRQGYADAAFFGSTRVNGYGLDAMEHLLYRREDSNVCPPQVLINSQGDWAALDTEARNRRRAEYALAVAADVKAQAVALDAAWREDGADFGKTLASGVAYGSVQAGLDAVFAGLFYLDQQVKDDKLGLPLGIVAGCATEVCPELVESVLSGRGRDNLLANLRGIRRVFTGGEGLGFDDLLVAEGAEALSATMLGHLDAALVAVEAIPADLGAAVGDGHPSVAAAHAAVRLVTDDLKSDFVTVLNLSLPAQGAADND